jgi:hypothetical protein
MTQDEIIEIASQVYGECVWHKSTLLRLETFAKLVAAKEREACAKVCDEVGEHPSLTPQHCAESIRARGEQA